MVVVVGRYGATVMWWVSSLLFLCLDELRWWWCGSNLLKLSSEGFNIQVTCDGLRAVTGFITLTRLEDFKKLSNSQKKKKKVKRDRNGHDVVTNSPQPDGRSACITLQQRHCRNEK